MQVPRLLISFSVRKACVDYEEDRGSKAVIFDTAASPFCKSTKVNPLKLRLHGAPGTSPRSG